MYRVIIVEDEPEIALSTKRFVEKKEDFQVTAIFSNGQEAMQLALMCCPEAEDHDHMKMIRIPNTAHIGEIEISEGMLPLVENNPDFEVLTEPYDLPFDENGNLF